MKLWQLTYNLTDSHCTTRWIDYWWSTDQPTITTPQHYWNMIFPGNYAVSDLQVEQYTGTTEPRAHIVRGV